MTKPGTPSLKPAQQGVVLLEAMIAILLFSIGVLAVVGLQAAMINNTSGAKSRMDASYIAQQRIGLMWSDPSNLAAYLEAAPGTDISNLLPAGRRITTQSGVQVTVTINWQETGAASGVTTHNFTTTASITGG